MIKNKKLSGWMKLGILLAVIAVVLVIVYIVQTLQNGMTVEIDKESAQQLVDSTFKVELPDINSEGSKNIAENISLTVKNVEVNKSKKEVIITCECTTRNIMPIMEQNNNKYFCAAYKLYDDNKKEGTMTTGINIMQAISGTMISDFALAEKQTFEMDIYYYEIEKGKLTPYLDDNTVNKIYGGIIDATKLVKETTSIEYNGETIDISNRGTLRGGVERCFSLDPYDSKKPDTTVPLIRFFNKQQYEFYRNFIQQSRWELLADGLKVTLLITLFSALLGILIGFVVAIIRVTNHKTGKLDTLCSLCKIYLSIMRGTPLLVQILIIHYVVLAPFKIETFISAVICFGLNSGAYVSEIVRGGIMSVDEGQMEAGRSLGFNYIKTMYYIVVPQAFKAVLPALANEFITLLKESSIAFAIGIRDLTESGNKIRAYTMNAFLPLLAVAVIYLIMVLGLSKCVSLLERRLQKGDKG